jgi:uncharacterized repeat protein (TIGR01451 family)
MLADIRDGMKWAVGQTVAGVPANANPARVVNLSLRALGPCPLDVQLAINQAKRAVFVAGSGNDFGSAENAWPANCAGVITVASISRQGARTRDSNTGVPVALAAPGASSTSVIDRILTTSNSGTTTPSANTYIPYGGTSFAAPHVSGIVSLMLSVKSTLVPPRVKTILQRTARPFPTGTDLDCTTATCGAGIADARRAVAAAKTDTRAGEFHSATLKADGTVWTWGFNGNGQLANGASLGEIRATPAQVSGLSGVRRLASGSYHNLAIEITGGARAWGYNGRGQLGDGTTTDQGTPVAVSSLTNVVDLAAGPDHSLALLSDGTVRAWGYNFFGALGDGSYTDRTTPVPVSGLTNVVAIAAGGKRSFALKDDGTVWAWGIISVVSPNGQTASISNVPVQVQNLQDVVAISAGGSSATGVDQEVALALKADGTVHAWGFSNFGELGDGTLNDRFLPAQVVGISDAVSIATSGWHSLASLAPGTVKAWGNNNSGELGDGQQSGTFSLTPVQSLSVSDAVDVSAGTAHTVVLRGTLGEYAWGSNLGGQLGDGSQIDSSLAIQVLGPNGTGLLNTGSASSASIDLSAVITQSATEVVIGQDIVYSILITNHGGNPATNVSVGVPLASEVTFLSASPGCTHLSGNVTCAIASLGAGAATTLQITARATVGGNIVASVFVDSGVTDPNPTNNTGAVTAYATNGQDSDIPTLPEWGVILLGSLLFAITIRQAALQRVRARVMR